MPRRRFPVLAFLAMAMGLLVPAAASASKSQYMIFEAPREMAGDDAQRQETFDEIQALGVKNVRVLLYWNTVVKSRNYKKKPAALDERNPNSKGYDWSRYDLIVNEAARRNVNVMFTITGPVPRWATLKRQGHTFKPVPYRFARFVEAAGRRYRSQVNTWSIWNEPNHPQFLQPQFVKGKPYSPGLYRKLYLAGLDGLRKSGNGRDRILAGETAPRGTPNVVPPITFLRGFFNGKKMRVDGYAHHPYTTKAGPFYRPGNQNDVTIGVLSRLTSALDRYSRHRGLGLYLTEFGIQSVPDPYVGVSELKQAEYRSISERIAYENPRVRAFSQYLMRDDMPRPGSRFQRYSGFESGLRHSDGRKKHSFDGFRLPLVADRTGTRNVRLWGLVRPATGKTSVTVQYRNKNGKRWIKLRTLATNTGGYWQMSTPYRAGRTYRVRWKAPDGTTHSGPKTGVYRAP
jgi:hypothetical protein